MKIKANAVWVTIMFLLLIAAVGLLISLGKGHGNPIFSDYSTYRADSKGTKAFYDSVKKLGYSPSRWRHALVSIEDADMLFIIGGWMTLMPFEADSILEWVKEGHVLVAASSTTNFLLKKLDVEVDFARDLGDRNDGSLLPLTQVSIYERNVHAIYIKSKAYFKPNFEDYSIHFADGGRPKVISFSRGKGDIILISDPYIFSNEGIREADNIYFLTNLLKVHAPQGKLIFDEYHHGYANERTVIGYLKERRLHYAVIYAVIVGVLILWHRGVRFGQIIPMQKSEERASIEYVRAIANIYQKAKLARHVLNCIYSDFTRTLTRYTRLVTKMEHPKMERSLAERGVANPKAVHRAIDFSETLLMREEEVEDNDLLIAVRQLQEAKELLVHRRK